MLDFGGSTPTSTLANGNTAASGTEIRWAGITTYEGKVLDLVGTITSGTYNAANTSKNGLSGLLGQLNILNGTSFGMQFTVVDPNAGDTSVELDTFKFVIFDLDTGTAGAPGESVTFIGADGTFEGYAISPTTEVAVSGTAIQPIFTATTEGFGSDNPTDPENLTQQQKDRSVQLQFTNASGFELKFDISEVSSGRNVIFAGGADEIGTITPIPEPSSSALIGLAAVGFILRRRR